MHRPMNVQTFLGCDAPYETARIVLFGAPFDSTTSYRPGARFASATMRGESYGLETYSPGQNLDLEDAAVYDGGDLELCFGDTERALHSIETYAEGILRDGKLPFLIGGEHLVTLPAFRAAHAIHEDISVIHFDAHADLREDYLGARLSHATVLRRIWDLTGDGRIHQFGIRSGDRREFQWANGHTRMQLFDFSGLSDAIEECKNHPVYLTVDLDVLDPSCFPGTGTPEAGGVTYLQLQEAVLQVIRGCRVAACDLVELSPPYDPSGISTATALKLLREMLLALEKPYIA